MKIRIEDNSVRYRLRRSEVDSLAEKGSIWATTQFPEGIFTYGLRTVEGLSDLRASLEGSSIVLEIPADWTADWPESSRVGFETEIRVDGKALHLLIEKDFVCLDRDIASQTDQFPNPKI